MDSKRILQKQIEFYSNLLKKHEATKKGHESASTSFCKLSKNSSWKQPPFSVYKMVKNSTQQLTSFDRKYPFNKFHHSGVTNQSARTVLHNKSNPFKPKFKFTSNKTIRNVNMPFNKAVCRRTVIKDPLAQCKKSVLCSENTCKTPSVTSTVLGKMSSNSQALIKEIESVTQMLKKTSENKSKTMINKTVQDKLPIYKNSSKDIKYCASSECNVLKKKDLFSKISDINKNLETSKLKSKTSSLDNKFIMKPSVMLEQASSEAKINKYSVIASKSQNIFRSSDVPKINSASSRYRRINAFTLVTPNKKFSHHGTLSINKRAKRKVNTKFKVINKAVTPSVNNKKVIILSNSGCKKYSPLAVEESDPLFKLLNDSTVDKLEQDLLALSTTMTATSTSDGKNDKVLQTSSNKMNSKLKSKKMSLKKSKTRISKYKVVNSVISGSFALKNRQSFTNLRNTEKINSKFSLINKHVQPVYATPMKQGKSILVKRLFKSKNAIINKNVSPTNYSAKMIKSKYFSLNKRKLPYEKHVLYPKVPLSGPKFKGYLSTKLHSKKNRYKAPVLTYHQRVMRRFSYYGCRTSNGQFNRSITANKYKKKLHNDFTTKIHRKTVINGKAYTRTPENKMKVVTPISANLASRMLHRSITRVLSAKSKKNLTKVNTYCMFYNRFGRCNKGVKCTYIHDPSKIAVCTRLLRGTCKIDGCPFSHEITPGKMAICSFFLVGACDKVDCPYRHEKLSPNAQLCKAFVQGYCPSGKECKKAHILICPKYIQGKCEKGTTCAFPHPPQKARKNVHREIDEEVKKQDDALLEKVARYFQQSEGTIMPCENKADDNAANLFVPKQKRLEEQPSFIPLFDDPAPLNKSCDGS